MTQYRPGEGRFVPEDLDPSLCTHIIYLSALIIEVEDGWGIGTVEWKDPDMDFTPESIVGESFAIDMDRGEEMYTRFHNVTCLLYTSDAADE